MNSSRAILEIEGSIQQRYKRALFPYKILQKGSSDFSNLYVHSTITLLFIKQTFEKNKSSRAVPENQTHFCPEIICVSINTQQTVKLLL